MKGPVGAWVLRSTIFFVTIQFKINNSQPVELGLALALAHGVKRWVWLTQKTHGGAGFSWSPFPGRLSFLCQVWCHWAKSPLVTQPVPQTYQELLVATWGGKWAKWRR